MPKLTFLLLAAVALVLATGGCDKIDGGSVSKVKNGLLAFDKSLTVGKAFDNYKYFKSTRWQALSTDNGRTIVEVKGIIDGDKHPEVKMNRVPVIKEVYIRFQFRLNQDDTFQLSWCGLGTEWTDGTKRGSDISDDMLECMGSLNAIYNNSPGKWFLNLRTGEAYHI